MQEIMIVSKSAVLDKTMLLSGPTTPYWDNANVFAKIHSKQGIGFKINLHVLLALIC